MKRLALFLLVVVICLVGGGICAENPAGIPVRTGDFAYLLPSLGEPGVWENLVPDAETAVALSRCYLQDSGFLALPDMDASFDTATETWCVSYYTQGVLGGGVDVYIRQSDGRTVICSGE